MNKFQVLRSPWPFVPCKQVVTQDPRLHLYFISCSLSSQPVPYWEVIAGMPANSHFRNVLPNSRFCGGETSNTESSGMQKVWFVYDHTHDDAEIEEIKYHYARHRTQSDSFDTPVSSMVSMHMVRTQQIFVNLSSWEIKLMEYIYILLFHF